MNTKDFTKASKTILLMLFLLMGIQTSWAQKHDFANGLDLEINDSIYWEDPHESICRSCEVLRDFLPEE